MKRYIPIARYWIKRIGWPVLLGCGMLCMGLAFYCLANVPLHQQIALQSRIRASRIGANKLAETRDSPEISIRQFYDALPVDSEVERVLESLYDDAFEANLSLQKANYQSDKIKDTHVTELDVELPLEGNYMEISKFVGMVLKTIPSASLNNIKMSRGNASESDLEADLYFSVLLRSKS